MCNSDSINVIPGTICIFECTVHDWHHGFKMRASGNFWNNTTIFGKDIDLGNDDIAQNMNAVFDNGGGGFVTTGFDSQYFHGVIIT